MLNFVGRVWGSVSSFPDPNNPSVDHLIPVSRAAGEGGSGDLTRGNVDLRLECRHTQLLVNYHILQ